MLEIMIWVGWMVDGDFMEVWFIQVVNLCIGVREEMFLQQWIVVEINVWDDMFGMEGCLFIFGKEVIWVVVEDYFVNLLYWYQCFGDQFGGIEQVEVKSKFIFFGD